LICWSAGQTVAGPCQYIHSWFWVPKVSWPYIPASVKLCYNRWSVKLHLGHKAKFLLLSDNCGLVVWRHPLWWENRSVIYNCCWPSQAQSFLGLSPAGLMTIFHHLRFETPPTWRARSLYLHPPGTGWLGYLRHRVPFKSPQTTAGLWWRYLNLPPHGSQGVMQKLCYDWQSVRQSVLVSSCILGPRPGFCYCQDSCRFVHVGCPLTRGRVCRFRDSCISGCPRYITFSPTTYKTLLPKIPSLLSDVLSELLPSDGLGTADARVCFWHPGNMFTGSCLAMDGITKHAIPAFSHHVTMWNITKECNIAC
jgi:hypothetical protein